MEPASILLFVMFALLLGAILSGIPAWLAIGGVPLLVGLAASGAGVFEFTLLTAFPQRVFGMMGNQLFIAIPLFILMGVMLERTGVASAMLDSVARLGRGSPLRLALGVLLISALIAASTGIAGATIVMLGLIAYPALTKAGVPVKLAAGMTVSAGTLGQIIPPSIVLIVLADQVSNAWQAAQRSAGNFAIEPVTVSDLFAAAMVPGLILVAAYGIFVTTRLWNSVPVMPGIRNEADANAHVGDEWHRGLFWLLPPLALIVAVLGSIITGIATATEAAAIGASGAILLGAARLGESRGGDRLVPLVAMAALALLIVPGVAGLSTGSMLPLALVLIGIVVVAMLASAGIVHRAGQLLPALRETVLLSGVIFAIIMGASLLALVFRGLGGEEIFTDFAQALPGDATTALLLLLVVVFLLGFVLEFIEIVFIIVPIAGPILFAMGIDPVWFAILLAINLQTSFLTPPMGVALFYFKSVAPAGFPIHLLYRGIIPFIAMQLAVVALVFWQPELALGLPRLLFE